VTSTAEAAKRVVIIGASLAGLRTAEALRESGHQGPITVVGDEAGVPYDRPPLSKQFLRGEWDSERIRLRSPTDLTEQFRLDLVPAKRAEHLRLGAKEVVLDDGKVLGFDKAVIATGARARTLAAANSHRSAHVLRTQADSDRLRPCLTPGARIVVVGAGFIGSEVAASAKALGCHVTIVEAAPVPLERQLGLFMGAACGALHARNGVELRCGIGVERCEADAVVLSDGTTLPADHVVVGVGAQPNSEWLADSGLKITDGLHVDEFCRAVTESGAPLDDIVGVGDVARFPNFRYQALDGSGSPLSMRIEHWTNAAEMAVNAAQTLSGKLHRYAPVPYFWSDQYSHKIQFFGRADGFDEVRIVDGDPADGTWVALYRRGERLVAALGVSKIRALIGFRQLLLRDASWEEALRTAGRA
jgi:NADPH-dependent 2,4-dienoyl-CoA reductase/sulfur reductase-like enzyme